MPTPTDAVTADALEYDRHIAATPETVWRLWDRSGPPGPLDGQIATLEPRAGGVFRLDYGQGDVASGHVLEADPPRRLVFTWGWETPTIPSSPAGAPSW